MSRESREPLGVPMMKPVRIALIFTMTALQGAPVRIKVAARFRVGQPCIIRKCLGARLQGRPC